MGARSPFRNPCATSDNAHYVKLQIGNQRILKSRRPVSSESMLKNIRNIGIPIQGTRNQTVRGLVEEIDPTSLSNLLGYSAHPRQARHSGYRSVVLIRHGQAPARRTGAFGVTLWTRRGC